MSIPFLAQTIFKDNVKLVFGDGSDLQIYHDGSSSRIADVGTGNLVISGTNLHLNDTATGEDFFRATSNGAVQLYYNGAEKFKTTSGGIDVTGTAAINETRTSSTATTSYTLVSKSTISSGTPGTGGIKVVYDDGSNEHAFGLVAGSTSADFLTSGPMHWYTNSDLDTHSATGFAMTIDTSQRVGIGLTNPSQKLTVSGNVMADRYYSTGTTVYYLDPSDTTTSAYVAGPVRIRQSSSYQSTALEVTAATGTTGDDGIFIKNYWAGGTPTVSSKNPFLSIGCADSSGHKSTIYLGEDASPANQESKIEYTHYGGVLSISVKGTGSYREHVRFGDQGSSTPRTSFSGNVGIGTTSPDTKLHVEGNLLVDAYNVGEDNGIFLREGFLTIDQPSITVWDMSNSGASPDGLSLNANDGIRFRENGGEVARFKDSNFGIGTASPSEKLEIVGNAILDASNANLKIKAGTTGTKGDIQWTFNTDSTVYASAGITYDNRSTDGFLIDSGYPITLDYASSYIRFSNNGSEKMRINSSGNVGIGEASPAERLHISGSVDNDDVAIRIDNDSDDNSSSTPPSAAVVFNTASNNGYVRVFGAPANTAGNHKMDIGASASSSYLTFSPSGSEKMRITSSGNVGIAETNPQQKLHVGGRGLFETGGSTADATTNTYEKGITLTGGNMRLVIDTSNVSNGGSYIQTRHSSTTYPSAYYTLALNPLGGKVGIGTNSPSHKLEVVGDGVVVSDGTDQGIIYLRSDRTDTYIKENGNYQIETGAPSGILFECDSNSNGNGIFNIKRQGASRFYITDGGNIGLATTSPRTKLDINGPLAVIGGTFTSGTSGADSNSASGIVLRRGKKILSGIPSGGNQDFYLRNLIEHDTGNNISIGQGGTSLIGNIYLRPGSSGTVSFFTTGSETMRIDSSGRLGLGTTNPTARFHLAQALSSNSERMGRFVPTRANSNIYGAVALRFEGLDYGNSMEFIRTNTYNGGALRFVNNTTQVGSISIGSSGTTYNTSSDYRLKENIVNLTGGIERVKQLQPKRFNFIQDPNVIVDGFLAHEAQTVVPQAVTGEKDGTYPNGDPIYQGIDQAKIIPLLTAALKEAIAKIENLETRIQTLENN
tara:strand:- start:3085 stop:6417 length:3333 start_codon:yes stop_codon:yes gene_type:complete